MQTFICLTEGMLFLSKRWCLWKGELHCVAMVTVKTASCVVWQLECQASNVIASVQWPLSAWIHASTSFSPLFNHIIHHSVLKFSSCQQDAATTHLYRRLVLGIHASASCPRRSNQLGLGHDCWLVTYQDWWTRVSHSALNCVTSAMCWCIVLVEDKHLPNAAYCWKQLWRQQHVSIVLSKWQ